MAAGDLPAVVERVERALAASAVPSSPPFLFMLCGLPGTGKSTVAKALAQRLAAAVIESDAVRALLFPSATFSAAESGEVFAVVHAVMERLLLKGVPVIMDATNVREQHREPVYRIAERAGARLYVVLVDAAPETVRERMERRAAQQQAGGRGLAGWDVYCRMRREWEPIARRHLVIDTSRDAGPAVERAIAMMQGSAAGMEKRVSCG